jgi:hypothetical protein
VKHLRYAITLTILLTSIICLGQKPKHAVAEQTSFCEDGADDLELKPVALPRLVLATVMNTKEGRDAQRELSQSEGTERDPTRLLKGKEIRLSDSGNRFFLVMGTYPMSGADNTWFWIVRQNGHKASILLFTGGNCLDLSAKTTLGYRNVITTWSSPSETETTTYVYDGKGYKVLRKRSHPNGER